MRRRSLVIGAFIASLPFTYLHVFTYSERPGTPAAEAAQVPHTVRKQRTHALRDGLGPRRADLGARGDRLAAPAQAHSFIVTVFVRSTTASATNGRDPCCCCCFSIAQCRINIFYGR